MSNIIRTLLCCFLSFISGVVITFFIIHIREREQARAAYYVAAKYYEQGNYAMAAALLNQSISKNPNDYGPFYLLGDVYKKTDNSDLARNMYKKALENIDKATEFDRQNIEKKLKEINSIK